MAAKRAPPARNRNHLLSTRLARLANLALILLVMGVTWYIGPQALIEQESDYNLWLVAQTYCYSLEGQAQVGENYTLDLARAQDFCQLTLTMLQPDPESNTPIARLKYLGELFWSVTFRPLWESLFVGGADAYWEQWRQDYADKLARQREARDASEITNNDQIPSMVDHGGELREDGVNPSFQAVVQEAILLEGEYGFPMEYVLSACRYDSGGLRQFNADGTVVVGINPDSKDWGLCQINDKWHPGLFATLDIKGSWRDNLRAGFIVMRGCWDRFSTVHDDEMQAKQMFGCYNGSGPEGIYADRVMPIWQSTYWQPILADLTAEAEEQAEVADGQRVEEDDIYRGEDEVSPYGNSPVEGTWTITQYAHEGTNAVDIGIAGNPCPENEEHYIIATMNGVVNVTNDYNNTVTVENARYVSSFLHNYVVLVNDGAEVEVGDRLAIMGHTGNTSFGTTGRGCDDGLHLHYYVYDKLLGVYVDAPSWVKP